MTIMKFGQRSFVAVKGLKERIEEAEKEIQMRNYRGLTKDGKWVYGDLLQHNNIKTIHSTGKPVVEVIPESVGQQVGLKDKNGKEIYEGDIVKYEAFAPKFTAGEIVYYVSGFNIKFDERNMTLLNNNVEIIGTIHTHPELIEGKEDD